MEIILTKSEGILTRQMDDGQIIFDSTFFYFSQLLGFFSPACCHSNVLEGTTQEMLEFTKMGKNCI